MLRESCACEDDIVDQNPVEQKEGFSLGRYQRCGGSEHTMACSRCKLSSCYWQAHKKICSPEEPCRIMCIGGCNIY